MGSMLGHEEQPADWDTWVRQWREDDTARVKHQAVAAARASSHELCSMVDAAATMLRVTASDDQGRKYDNPDLHFDLGRFPVLTRLGVDLNWDGCRDPDTHNMGFVHLDDVPPGLHELRVSNAAGNLTEIGDVKPCDAQLHALSPALLPQLSTLELFGVGLATTDLPMHLFPALTRLVVEQCEGSAQGPPLKLDLSPASKLLHLQLLNCSNIVCPEVACVPDLTHLMFCPADYDVGLEQLDLGLTGGQLRTALVHLDLNDNYDLTSLDLSCVPNLRVLSLSCCQELPAVDLSPCSQLSSLVAPYSEALSELILGPSAATLQELDVDWCQGLVHVEGLANCAQLRTFKRSGWHLPEISLNFGQLTKVHLSNSQDLTSLEQLPLTLEQFECCSSTQLTKLDIARCTNLRHLRCQHCPLHELDLPAAPHMTLLECSPPSPHLPLHHTPSLQRLAVDSSPSLSSLPLQHTPHLTSLYVEDCPALTSLSLDCVPQLRELRIYSMPSTFKLSIPHTAQLQNLYIKALGTREIDLSCCSQLTFLSINNCTRLRRLRGFKQCSALKELSLAGCTYLELDVSHCRGLDKLTINSYTLKGFARDT